VAANVSFGAAYATDILLAQKVFYGQDFGGLFAVMLVLSTQCLGYAFAGVMRRFLVWPGAMLWPANLINITLFHTLHHDKEPEVLGWTISRYRWFLYCFGGMFFWNWIPGYIFTAVSNFAFVTWIRPNDVVLNQVFGSFTGRASFDTVDSRLGCDSANNRLVSDHGISCIALDDSVLGNRQRFYRVCVLDLDHHTNPSLHEQLVRQVHAYLNVPELRQYRTDLQCLQNTERPIRI